VLNVYNGWPLISHFKNFATKKVINIINTRMINLSKRVYFLSVFAIMLSGIKPALCAATEAPAAAKDYQLATDIADYYIKSFFSEGKDTEAATVKEHAAHEIRPAKLGEKTKREVVFNRIFTESKKYALLQEKTVPVLNKYAWGDLHLFYGTTSEPAHHLLSRINRTVTILGEGVLATLLVTPTSSLEELGKRQQVIQTFLDSTVEVDQLKASLQRYQAAEQSVLSLFTPTDPLYTKEYRKYMDAYFYTKNDERANKNAGWLEFKKRFFRDFWGIKLNFLWPVITPLTQEILYSKAMSGPSVRRGLWIGALPYYGGWYKWDQLKKYASSHDATTFGIATIVGEACYTWTAYQGISNYLEYSSVLRNLAFRMADVQALVVAATEVSECVAASPTLEAMYGARLTKMRSLLAHAQESTELGNLVNYLQTLPYKHWSYFFNNAGKLLASHKLFTAHKDAFVDAMYELGELDAFVSIATLMQEAQNHSTSHAYVFTKFLDRSQKQKPYIKLEDMWNPFLDAKEAVGNSVVMDAAGGTSNIILTGPNAGGKSTFLTGVATSLLLSQTFGIAPAKEAVLTPFDKINTSIDITDDIAAGKSLFMAEVDRAQKHINLLAGLQQDEFSFSIFDEPFSGTNPTEGAAAEYSVLEAMADYTNTLNIVATHYPIVMLLEKNVPEKGFVNYKVYITYQGAEKKLNYTYKVIPGKSNQAIAIDILEEQGYDTRLLKRAREIIEHPERYLSTF
jgi:DNA mismatch repair protein MutS